MTLPILYTFRRCPYAMRARMVLVALGIQCEVREIKLKDKPRSLLEASPKGSVPVMILADETVLEESMDIIYWSLKNKPDNELCPGLTAQKSISEFITINDGDFKKNLDHYKYFKADKPHPLIHYRNECEKFLQKLEQQLVLNNYLFDTKLTYGDLAILPFVRQLSLVEPRWFQTSPYLATREWLKKWQESTLFEGGMKKYDLWNPDTKTVTYLF